MTCRVSSIDKVPTQALGRHHTLLVRAASAGREFFFSVLWTIWISELFHCQVPERTTRLLHISDVSLAEIFLTTSICSACLKRKNELVLPRPSFRHDLRRHGLLHPVNLLPLLNLSCRRRQTLSKARTLSSSETRTMQVRPSLNLRHRICITRTSLMTV